MGDGVIFLWEHDEWNQNELDNIIVVAHEVCNEYSSTFYPSVAWEYKKSGN